MIFSEVVFFLFGGLICVGVLLLADVLFPKYPFLTCDGTRSLNVLFVVLATLIIIIIGVDKFLW